MAIRAGSSAHGDAIAARRPLLWADHQHVVTQMFARCYENRWDSQEEAPVQTRSGPVRWMRIGVAVAAMGLAAGVMAPLAQAQSSTIKIVSSLPRTGSSKGQ